MKCTRYGVYRKYDKNVIEPTSHEVLGVHQRYSTTKFCKSCEVMIMYMVVSFTSPKWKNFKKGIMIYTYIKIQSRLQQPKTSLLHRYIKDLWFVEVDWGAQEGQRTTTKPNKTKPNNTISTYLGKIFWRNQTISHQTAGQLRGWHSLFPSCPAWVLAIQQIGH